MNQFDKKFQRAKMNPQSVTKDELLYLAQYIGAEIDKKSGKGGHYKLKFPSGAKYILPSHLKVYATLETLDLIEKEKKNGIK